MLAGKAIRNGRRLVGMFTFADRRGAKVSTSSPVAIRSKRSNNPAKVLVQFRAPVRLYCQSCARSGVISFSIVNPMNSESGKEARDLPAT